MSKPDNDDFPQPAVDFGTPADFIDVFEPAFRQGMAMQKRSVNIDQSAPAPALDSVDKLGLFGDVFGVE